jgi:hypothetical protein
MARLPDFTADCASCAALCCLALAFDAGEDFGFDKPAGLPCPNLDGHLGCAIYDRLDAEGFSGCVRYDCLGAGQRVVQEVFSGASWREEPALAEPMMAAFAAMRQVQEGLELLLAAQALDLPETLEAELDTLLTLYAPDEGWDEAALARFTEARVPARLAAFLPKLGSYL